MLFFRAHLFGTVLALMTIFFLIWIVAGSWSLALFVAFVVSLALGSI